MEKDWEKRRSYFVRLHLKQALVLLELGTIGTIWYYWKNYKTGKGLERHRRIKHHEITEDMITKRFVSKLITRPFKIKRLMKDQDLSF